jgi:hypothetical protein
MVCDMPTPSRRPLKPNPFVSLRDPKTGKWRVIFAFSLNSIRQGADSLKQRSTP